MTLSPRNLNLSSSCLLAVLLSGSGAVSAQQPAPPGMDLATFAARRFPQPVRVGDLEGRTVLQPDESRRVLGHVVQVVRLGNGTTAIVMTYGGHFGFRARQIAVPIDAVVLLGNELEVLDFTPQQLSAFPTYDDAAGALPANEIIRMGLAHPSH